MKNLPLALGPVTGIGEPVRRLGGDDNDVAGRDGQLLVARGEDGRPGLEARQPELHS
jgi:hypothetical protein